MFLNYFISEKVTTALARIISDVSERLAPIRCFCKQRGLLNHQWKTGRVHISDCFNIKNPKKRKHPFNPRLGYFAVFSPTVIWFWIVGSKFLCSTFYNYSRFCRTSSATSCHLLPPSRFSTMPRIFLLATPMKLYFGFFNFLKWGHSTKGLIFAGIENVWDGIYTK